MVYDSDDVERSAQRELRAVEELQTVEDERLLQMVHEAFDDARSPLYATGFASSSYAVDGARLALRLIARLGRRYVGEARGFAEDDRG